ncbi:MAG: TerB family tellurite resistance protein [Hyphomicrobiaceae bacterium]|nr:TerB family tellurite resistance protein [Hyphomicrobiaceae bacterium]
MHILLGILGVIGSLGMLLWRIKMASDAAKDIAQTAQGAKNYLRRRRWEKRATADPLKDMEDPREAAATMMAALAAYDSTISEREEKTILHEIKTNFDTDDRLASELLAHGRWLSKDAGDLNSFLSHLMPPIMRHLGPKEKNDLLTMLTNVANANGEASDLEKDAILFVKRHMGI